MADEHLDGFLGLVGEWKAAYSHASISYCGLKTKDGTFLLFSRIRLQFQPSFQKRRPYSLETKQLIAGRLEKTISVKKVHALIENAKSGRLQVGDKTLALLPESGGFRFYLTHADQPLPCILVMQGASLHQVMSMRCRQEKLNWELNSAREPFESLEELLTFLDLPAITVGQSSTRIEIDASSPGEIENTSTIKDGRGVVSMRISTRLDHHKIHLGYHYLDANGERIASAVSGSNLKWKSSRAFRTAKHSISVRGTPVMRVHLCYQEIPLHSFTLTDPSHLPNMHHAIHEGIDPGSAILQELLLRPSKSDAEEFEKAVAILFNLLGFSTSHYGSVKRLTDGPDGIAIARSGNVAVIECTTAAVDNKDKLTKLVRRSNHIKNRLKEAGHSSVDVIPIAITCLPRSEGLPNVKPAEEMKVAVVCKEELKTLLERVRPATNSDQCLEYLKKLVPLTKADWMEQFRNG